MTNGCKKGKAGERELAKALVEFGIVQSARRGQQHTGLEGQDVVTNVTGLHIECKRVERLNLNKAMDQAVRDAAGQPGDPVPVVCHRQNRKPWLVTVRLADLMELVRVLGGE
jgi:Holliday junction resolvase